MHKKITFTLDMDVKMLYIKNTKTIKLMCKGINGKKNGFTKRYI